MPLHVLLTLREHALRHDLPDGPGQDDGGQDRQEHQDLVLVTYVEGDEHRQHSDPCPRRNPKNERYQFRHGLLLSSSSRDHCAPFLKSQPETCGSIGAASRPIHLALRILVSAYKGTLT